MKVQQLINHLKDLHPDMEVMVQVDSSYEGFKFLNIESVEQFETPAHESYVGIFPHQETESNLN